MVPHVFDSSAKPLVVIPTGAAALLAGAERRNPGSIPPTGNP